MGGDIDDDSETCRRNAISFFDQSSDCSVGPTTESPFGPSDGSVALKGADVSVSVVVGVDDDGDDDDDGSVAIHMRRDPHRYEKDSSNAPLPRGTKRHKKSQDEDDSAVTSDDNGGDATTQHMLTAMKSFGDQMTQCFQYWVDTVAHLARGDQLYRQRKELVDWINDYDRDILESELRIVESDHERKKQQLLEDHVRQTKQTLAETERQLKSIKNQIQEYERKIKEKDEKKPASIPNYVIGGDEDEDGSSPCW